MIEFFFLSVILLLFSVLFKKNKIALLAAFLVLFIISAFRDISVGTDTKGYLMLFERVNQGIDIRQELLWQKLNQFIASMGGDFEVLLIISSVLVLAPIFVIAQKYSTNPMLSIFFYYTLYLYFPSLNITRQAIAVSLILIAIVFLYNNKRKYFLFFVILATGFHTTALAALCLYFYNCSGDLLLCQAAFL